MLYPKLDRFEIYHRQTDEARDCLVVEIFVILAMEKKSPMWQMYLPKSYIQILVKAFFYSTFFIFKWHNIIIAINKKYFLTLFIIFLPNCSL